MPDLAKSAIFKGAALFVVLITAALSPAAAPPPTRRGPPVAFLGKAHGEIAIVDESSEAYFKLLQPMEMSAKTGAPITGKTTEAEQDECRRRYQQAVLEFTSEEMLAIEALAARISKAA